MTDAPGSRTRWALAGSAVSGYAGTFADLVARGEDVDGEARLADAIAPRCARILDAGSGMGRVAAALRTRGHRVVAVEPDPRSSRSRAAPTPTSRSCPSTSPASTPGRARST
jgi:SAM-dependent methyltransferase